MTGFPTPIQTPYAYQKALSLVLAGVAGSAFAEGEGGSATGAVQWHQADSSTAPAVNPTAKIQLAYVQAPFHASEDNGQG